MPPGDLFKARSILPRLSGLRLVVALLLAPAGIVAAGESQQVPGGTMAATLRPFVEQHQMAGAVILVASPDKVLCLEAAGYADLAANNMRSCRWSSSPVASINTPMRASTRPRGSSRW